MDWKDTAAKISNVAPMIGSLFGPAGLIAGTGIKLLSSLFGLKESEVTPEKVDELLSTNPESLIKLKEFELKNREMIFGYCMKIHEIELQDVISARSREVEVVKATGKRDKLQGLLAIFGWLAPVSLVILLLFHGLPKGITSDAAALVGGFVGIIIGEYKTIYGYYFGSSRGSSENRDMLDRVLRNGNK